MRTSADRFIGFGCNHLHDFEKHGMALRGLDHAGLVPIESIGPEDKLDTLCKAGLPCYWTGEGAVLVHPLEVIRWAIGLGVWAKNGTPALLAELETWAHGLWPNPTKAV